MAKPGRRSAAAALVTAAASVAILGIGAARGTDQSITGKKLLLKGSKFVLLSKDPSIGIAGSDPVGDADSSISFNDGSGPVSLAMPGTLWSANRAGTVFKYKNPAAPGGPSVVKVAKVGSGLLKVVGKGAPIAVPNGPASIDVVVGVDSGARTYHLTFIGTGDGSKFLFKEVPPVCGNNVREGSEACDGTDDADCPGQCAPDCLCGGCCDHPDIVGANPAACAGGSGFEVQGCINDGGTPAPAGTVCGKSVGCTAPPAAASNDCCALEGPGGGGYSAFRECFYVDPQVCSGPAFGGVSSTGVCMPDGSCQPQP